METPSKKRGKINKKSTYTIHYKYPITSLKKNQWELPLQSIVCKEKKRFKVQLSSRHHSKNKTINQ